MKQDNNLEKGTETGFDQGRIAFQGEHGAYSEEAILEHFPASSTQTLPCASFRDVFSAVSTSQAGLGFAPIENSLAGSIYQVYDLLSRNDLWIVGEHYLRVRHCLIGSPGAKIQQIRKVISHPQALMQCEGYLRRLGGVASEPVYDTAGSVKMMSEQPDPSVAAIASRHAARRFGMQILAEGIEDDPANFTRFLILSDQPVVPQGVAKTSIVFTLENEPGALYKTMSAFALRGIDLTRIESRPLVGKPWDYLFYLDFRGAVQDALVQRALANLEEFCLMLRVFGSYPDSRSKG